MLRADAAQRQRQRQTAWDSCDDRAPPAGESCEASRDWMDSPAVPGEAVQRHVMIISKSSIVDEVHFEAWGS